jgi:hypothetical protein
LLGSASTNEVAMNVAADLNAVWMATGGLPKFVVAPSQIEIRLKNDAATSIYH